MSTCELIQNNDAIDGCIRIPAQLALVKAVALRQFHQNIFAAGKCWLSEN